MDNRIFDFHFHLLFKHHICDQKDFNKDLELRGLGKLLSDVMGGAFGSQSSPSQVKQSNLYLGVIALISIEHAFANKVLNVLNIDLSPVLPLDKDLFKRTKEGKTTYFDEFRKQIQAYASEGTRETLAQNYGIKYLHRRDFADLISEDKNATREKILKKLESPGIRYMTFSIEGGHNLSNVPIRKEMQSLNPELQLKAIQDDDSNLDFISMNLCHLSEIPEQSLGGFAQGVNGLSQVAFSSVDFFPTTGLGVSERGKKVIKQALTHPTKPVLIDVKHMSVYTRLHYYRLKAKLAREFPLTERLPIISSHTGFTFTSVTDYVANKRFRSRTYTSDKVGRLICEVEPENRKIGRTNDTINKKLWCNPWSINLFDDEIITIMESKGLIGISLDQRILGATRMFADSQHPRFFEKESIPELEWKKLFRDGQLPGVEGLEKLISAPSREERHIMLLSLHIIHAVKIGYANLTWLDDESPWDHICIGSDFDGLINPINGFDNVIDLRKMRNELLRYLPMADKYLDFNENIPVIPKKPGSGIDTVKLNSLIEKFLFKNGQDFIVRFLSNWTI
jgi:microsomal dipeptidase-like Zn-dependent dipeptidase